MSDFCHRVDFKYVNRKQLENIIKAGVFDSLENNRAKLFENIDVIMRNVYAATEVKTSEQKSLFGAEELSTKIKFREIAEWPYLERLRYEAEAIGFYLSAHPLDIYADSMKKLGAKNSVEVLQNIKAGDSIKANIAACVESFQKRLSKSGNKYAFVGLSDTTGSFEALLFSEGLIKYEEVLNSGVPVLVKLTIDKQSEDANPRIMINAVKTLDEAIAEQAKGLIINITNIDAVAAVKDILQKDKQGANKIYIVPEITDWDVRIELSGGYAFYDVNLISKIRAVPGVSSVKEI